MEYKKSRLELVDSNSMQGSSSSMSTPTPSPSPGVGGGLGGSFNSGGGSGPYRGRYTRSSLGAGGPTPSSSLHRFSPYTVSRDRPAPRRSIPVIFAKRDNEPLNRPGSVFGGGGQSGSPGFSGYGYGTTSSTAQKIMNTLASMSTPVVNAGRVRIDAIKPVKPVVMGSSALNTSGTFLSSSFKYCGPPKTLSPLLVPKTPSGIRPDASVWSLKCLSIPPKMVDCGTNTTEQFCSSTSGEDKNKQNSSQTQAVAQQRMNNASDISSSSTLENNHGSLRLADLLAKCRPVNGEYEFDKPWSLLEVDKYLGSDRYKKDMAESDTSSLSDESNEDSQMSNHKIPNGVSSTVSKVKQESFKANSFQWGAPKEKQWECPSCMIFNKCTDTKCVCCGTQNPGMNSTVDKIDSGKTTVSTSKSVAKWECPTCMVLNEATAVACVCCSERNPNPVADKTQKDVPSSETPAPSFKFGFGTTSTSTTTTTTSVSPFPGSGFKFGTPAQDKPPLTLANENHSTGFSFGFKATISPISSSKGASVQNTSTGAGCGLSFGLPSPKPSNSSSGSFKYGVTSSDEEAPMRDQKNAIELWQCEVCPTQNKFENFSCQTCGSPRPHEFDVGYKKPESKPTTDITFQPVLAKKSLPPSVPIFSATPSTNSATGLTFTSGSFTTFNSGNPFGGDSGGFGTFGSSSGSGTFGNTAMNNTSPPVTQAQGAKGIGAGTPSSLSSGSAAPFKFGSPPTSTFASPPKRKHDGTEGPGDVDAAKKPPPAYHFGPSSNTPTQKLNEITATTAPSPTPTATNPAGFLEALNNASKAVKASNEKQPTTAVTTPSLSFGGQPIKQPFQFGSNTPTTAAPAFGSGSSNSSFSFGSGGINPTQALVVPNPLASNSNQQSTASAPSTQFNLTPNFNFGATASSPPGPFNFGGTPNSSSTTFFGNPSSNAGGPTLFQFSSSPSTNPGGDRKIKKAARRYPR